MMHACAHVHLELGDESPGDIKCREPSRVSWTRLTDTQTQRLEDATSGIFSPEEKAARRPRGSCWSETWSWEPRGWDRRAGARKAGGDRDQVRQIAPRTTQTVGIWERRDLWLRVIVSFSLCWFCMASSGLFVSRMLEHKYASLSSLSTHLSSPSVGSRSHSRRTAPQSAGPGAPVASVPS